MFNNLLADSAKWYPFLFDNTENTIYSLLIWLTLALVITVAITSTILKGDKRKKFLKYALMFSIVYACVLSIYFLTKEFIQNKKDGAFLTILFVPIALLILSFAVSAVLLIFKNNKKTLLFSAALVCLALVATLVCIGIHFASGDGAEMNYITNDDVNSIALYVCSLLFIIAVVAVAFLFDKTPNVFDTKSIAYAGVCIAMSFALSYLRIVKMPQGGSITIASLLPLMLYSYMFGTKKGVLAGAIYGLMQAIQDPYIIHPAQFLLDYPVAFACIGLAGIFANNKIFEKIPQLQFALGAIIAGLCRFVMHFFSGVFAFGAFAGGENVYLYSLGYQAGYVLPDIAIVVVVGILIFSSPSVVNLLRSHRVTKEQQETSL